MNFTIAIDDKFHYAWPSVSELSRYFETESSPGIFGSSREGGCSLTASGMDDTDDKPDGRHRSNASLYVQGLRPHGVSIMHRHWNGNSQISTIHHSRGDLSRRLIFVEDPNGSQISVGLLVPSRFAWIAVRHFVETKGGLAPDVPWVDAVELPPDTFPELAPPDPSKWKKTI